MKIEFHVKDVVITEKQKNIMEKKLLRMKKYSPEEPMFLDVYLQDESGIEKGGIDQSVSLSLTFGKEKIFVKEKSAKVMQAFTFALKHLERSLQEFRDKNIDKTNRGGGARFDKLYGVLKRVNLRKIRGKINKEY